MVVWSLFDGSGLMVTPWAEAGHTCYCFNFEDEDHGSYKDVAAQHDDIHYVNAWINASFVRRAIRGKWPTPDIIFAFPPCTDIASSGARWFKSKLSADPECQNKAVATARIAETLANYFGVPFMVENPRGILSTRREANTIIQLAERIQFIHARTGERAATKNNRDSQIIIFGRRPNPDGARIVQSSIADIAKYL